MNEETMKRNECKNVEGSRRTDKFQQSLYQGLATEMILFYTVDLAFRGHGVSLFYKFVHRIFAGLQQEK